MDDASSIREPLFIQISGLAKRHFIIHDKTPHAPINKGNTQRWGHMNNAPHHSVVDTIGQYIHNTFAGSQHATNTRDRCSLYPDVFFSYGYRLFSGTASRHPQSHQLAMTTNDIRSLFRTGPLYVPYKRGDRLLGFTKHKVPAHMQRNNQRYSHERANHTREKCRCVCRTHTGTACREGPWTPLQRIPCRYSTSQALC